MPIHRMPLSITAILLSGAAAAAAPFSAGRPLSNVEKATYIYTGADYSVSVPAGQSTLIGAFNDACQHHIPPMLSGTADHGVVTTKEGVRRSCGNAAEPVTEVWYRPAANFRGVDHVMLVPYRSYITITVR
jgi:hypothetical protein